MGANAEVAPEPVPVEATTTQWSVHVTEAELLPDVDAIMSTSNVIESFPDPSVHLKGWRILAPGRIGRLVGCTGAFGNEERGIRIQSVHG